MTLQDQPAQYFQEDPKLWPFFRYALGAIDGSHIHLRAPASLQAACINRKSVTTQNCLFCSSFNLIFTYVVTGWEGSASDAWIYQYAINKGLKIPDGWYLLADAGFPHCKELLVPYQGVCYHLAEWGRANSQYILFSSQFEYILMSCF